MNGSSKAVRRLTLRLGLGVLGLVEVTMGGARGALGWRLSVILNSVPPPPPPVPAAPDAPASKPPTTDFILLFIITIDAPFGR